MLEGLRHVFEGAVDLLEGDDVGLAHEFPEVLELQLELARVGALHQSDAPAVPRDEAERGEGKQRESNELP